MIYGYMKKKNSLSIVHPFFQTNHVKFLLLPECVSLIKKIKLVRATVDYKR